MEEKSREERREGRGKGRREGDKVLTDREETKAKKAKEK